MKSLPAIPAKVTELMQPGCRVRLSLPERTLEKNGGQRGEDAAARPLGDRRVAEPQSAPCHGRLTSGGASPARDPAGAAQGSGA